MPSHAENSSRNHASSSRAANWYVITGAPCSGKSAVIHALAKCGFSVIHEVARAFIDRQLAGGRSLAQIKADTLAFERHILLEKVRIENDLPLHQVTFLDRAIPDSIAYFRLEGLNPDEPLRHSRHRRYARVFFFERLSFEKDRVRAENQAMAVRLESLLAKAYAELGYALVRVPVMSIVERTEFVLRHSLIR